MPADLELHCLRPSSGHFAFVLRKVSGVEMEAERFIIAYDVALFLKVQWLDWSRSPPIILYPAPRIIRALLLVSLGWKLINPLHHENFFFYFHVRSLEERCHYTVDNYLSYRHYEHYAQHTNTLVFTHTHMHAPNQNKQPVNHCNNIRGPYQQSYPHH